MKTTSNALTGFEELETRLLLSGDVSVILDSGNLTITGDALANDIRILDNNQGGIRVLGLNGTLINGASTAFNSGADSVADVTASMKGGDDFVQFRADQATGIVKIITSAGADKVTVDSRAIIAKTLSVNTGTGDDCVKISDSDVLGRGVIVTGAGNDKVIIDAETTIAKGATLKTGDGNDKFRAENSTVKGKVLVDLGTGNDREGLFDMLFTGDHSWSGDDGVDVIVVDNTEFKRNVTVLGGTGRDYVIVTNNIFGRTSADTLSVDTGGGNDFVVATDNTFNSDGLVDGGVGANDNLSESGNTFIGTIDDVNFEGTVAPTNITQLTNSVLNFNC